MKKFLNILAAAALLCACTEQIVLNNGESVLLENWTLNQEGSSEVYDAAVPSTVAGVLMDNGVLPADLLEADNYYSVDKSIFDKTWIYKTSFKAKVNEGQRYDLIFNGLNYYADVFLNGTQIASADTTYGTFIPREYDVTKLLSSVNNLEVRIGRAQKGDLNIGFVDWNPRPLDESMGITQTVTLRASGAVSIKDVFVIPDLDTETLAEADLEVRVTLRNNLDEAVEGNIVLDIQDGETCSVPVALAAGEETIIALTPEQAANLHIDNPRVWWSYELGSPELYDLGVDIEVNGTDLLWRGRRNHNRVLRGL